MAGRHFAPLPAGTDFFARALDGGERFPEYSRRRADVDLDMAVGCFLCRHGDGFSMEAGSMSSGKGLALSRCLLPSVDRRRDKKESGSTALSGHQDPVGRRAAAAPHPFAPEYGPAG